MKQVLSKIFKNSLDYYNSIVVKKRPKVFVIGRNKTGTTSIKKEFLKRGFIVGNQSTSENLIDAYLSQDFDKII